MGMWYFLIWVVSFVVMKNRTEKPGSSSSSGTSDHYPVENTQRLQLHKTFRMHRKTEMNFNRIFQCRTE